MKYKLTWERKMIRIRLTFLTLFFMSFWSLMPAVYAQKDSLNPVQLDPVDLRWIRPSGELPFSGTNVNRDDIRGRMGNGSINNVMENIPSMTSTSDAGTGIGNTNMRIRGIDHTRINVTINGIELNDAESQGTWFVNLPNFAFYVDNVTLQRGVGTSSNGAAAFGASMNFSTLEGASLKPFFEVSSAAGSFRTFRNSVSAGTGLINKRFSMAASYSNLQSNGYIDRATANLNSIYLTANYRLLNLKKNKNYGTLRFNVLYGKEITGLAWDGVPEDSLKTNRTFNPCGLYYDQNGNIRYYDNETDNYEQTHYQLFYSYSGEKVKEKTRHGWDIGIGLHMTRGYGYYEQYKDDKKLADYGLPDFIFGGDTLKKTDLVRRKFLDNYFYGFTFNISDDIRWSEKSARLKWTVGGSLNRYDGDHYGTLIWLQYAGAIPVNHRWYYNRSNKTQGNIYGKVEYMPVKRLLLYGDLQYRFIDYKMKGMNDNLTDLTQNYQWNFVNPKIGVSYYLDRLQRNSVYFAFAVSHREPTRSDIVDAPGNKKPVPETLYDFELGYHLQTRKFAFNANAYYMYYIDQLVLTGEINDMGDPIMANVDRSYRTGLELVASYRPARFFMWRINGTFSINKIADYTHYTDDWASWGEQVAQRLGTTDISFSPSVVAGNEFIFTPVRNFDISIVTKFVSSQYLDNTSDKNHILKPYSFTNLQFSYKINTRPIPEIALFFQINNIFNAQYETNGWLYRYYDGSGDQRAEYYDAGYFPQAGINVMGGVTLKF